MAEIVVMPQAGNSVESCIVVSWRVSEGDTVAVGDILCEIETDKATIEVESTAAGTVLKRYAEEGDEVPVKDPLVAVGDAGESAPGTDGTAGAGETADENRSGATGSSAPGTGAENGVIRSFTTGEVRVSPRARSRAASLGIDPTNLAGSGPGGRVIERDVIAAAEAGGAGVSSGARQTAPRSTSPEPIATGTEQPFTDIAITGIRRTIAKRMHASLQESAQLTLHRQADARALQEYRRKVKERDASGGGANTRRPGESGALQISINDMVNFAVVRTLLQYPEMNAHYLETGIRRFAGVDLGFAVDTPRGLLVPTVQGADRMSLAALATRTRELAQRAVAGNATPDDLAPATFTVTNLGGLGIEHFTPVLNTPQVGILGVGTIVPGYGMNDEGEASVIPQIGLSLTIDHRAVDGAPGARFLAALAENLAFFELTLAR
ncbi:MAG: dihydrolipoamide acetyltransferase family protein [Alkalispirochaeta sp.]